MRIKMGRDKRTNLGACVGDDDGKSLCNNGEEAAGSMLIGVHHFNKRRHVDFPGIVVRV